MYEGKGERMKKRFFTNCFRLLAIGFLLAGVNALATVVWNGTASNATNEDVDIIADSDINNVTISALTTDVLVTMTVGDVVLTGISEPGLCLVTNLEHTITFQVDNNLFFTGDSDTTLVITVSGNGTVVFQIDDDKTVSFSSSSDTAEGTYILVDMDIVGAGYDYTPTLKFIRQDQVSSSAHVKIVVGNKSIMSYVAETMVSTGTADEEGYIVFDPANTGSGRMHLKVEDGGNVYVGGNLIADTGCPLVSDIRFDLPAGKKARFVVENSVGASANAGLLVTNENTTYPSLLINPWREAASFDGVRHGFVQGADSMVFIDSDSFVDYVGLYNDFCPTPDIPAATLDGREVEQVVKARNASAYIVDGNTDEDSLRAEIQMADEAALFFRSGVDVNGDVSWYENDQSYSFTVLPANRSTDEGDIVFDVEGKVNIVGSGGSFNSKVEVLSWEVDPTGGSVLIWGSETTFPLRTFTQDGNGDYLQYNAACFFINERVNYWETNLVHTDKIHVVNEKDDINSEPTYIGGDSFVIDQTPYARPMMAFYDSYFRIHTCVALTGVDLRIPNGTILDQMAGIPRKAAGSNSSEFVFYHNGIAYRDGTGRHMILGTQSGSATCNPCCADISKDSHLDIVQDQALPSALTHELALTTSENNSTIIPSVPASIEGQAEIHTIYLGHSSNISIGYSADDVSATFTAPLTTFPTMRISGNYFSFETRGGPDSSPETSAITGRGGIFVDTNGVFTIDSGYRANMSTMVVKTDNGSINLPREQVYFDNRIGIADWQVDLTDSAQRELIGASETLSDYTMNWRAVTKDYDNFTPYQVDNYNPCSIPAVTAANVASLPVVYGQVNQFQIKGSRIGNPAHLKVDDGWIRELTFLCGCDSADAPVAVLVLDNHGRVGLGSTHRNIDSNGSHITLGINGINIIADGDGIVDINEDVIIDNVCHILKGPNFTTGDKLVFYSDCERAITIKSTGTLNMTQFTTEDDVIEFAGNLKLILEPGSHVVFGGGIMRATDQVIIETATVKDLEQFDFGLAPPSVTDPIRVDFIGTGTLQLDEDSTFFIGDDSYVGLVTDSCYTNTTNLLFEIGDRARMIVGSRTGTRNSVFQIGNTTDIVGSSIIWSLHLNGVDSLFEIASRGFVGLGVGMGDNFYASPSDWLIDGLYNVDFIEILVPAGTFQHNRIFNSDDAYASLLAINDFVTSFSFDYTSAITNDGTQATILGGGNMLLLTTTGTPVAATVQTTDGVLSTTLTVGLFSSKALLDVKTAPTMPITGGLLLFNYLTSYDANPALARFVNASQDEHNLLSLGFPDGGKISRVLTDEIVGQGGIPVARKDFVHTLSQGAVFANFIPGTTYPRTLTSVVELP